MWVPQSEQDLKDAIANATVRETATFEAKVALPTPGKNKDLAKDICAMTVDGGVLLYGLGGEDPTRPDKLQPFDLAGAAERIDQVSQTSISEPPHIEIHDIASDDHLGTGYLVVTVPASPRAPHMLTLDGDNRYWGRGATGNRILTEGEVSRLYARREAWEVDRRAWLAGYVDAPPFQYEQPLDHVGLMLTAARPVSPTGEFVRGLAAPALPDQLLRDGITRVGNEQDPYPGQGTSGLGQAFALLRQGSERWVLSSERDTSSEYQARAEVTADGELAYWHSPVINQSARFGGSDRLLLMEQSVTRGVHQGLAAARWLLEQGGYVGSVDIGVAVLGLDGASGASIHNAFGDEPLYGDARYMRDERITMHEARTDLPAVVSRILAPLYDVVSAHGYDPYGEARQLPA